MLMCKKCFNIGVDEKCFYCNNDVFFVDDLIAPSIQLLNLKHYKTSFCCSGHISFCYAPYITFSKRYPFIDTPKYWMHIDTVLCDYQNAKVSALYLQSKCKNQFKKAVEEDHSFIESLALLNKYIISLYRWSYSLESI